MNEKRLAFLMRAAIILIGMCGTLFCIFWLPISFGERELTAFSWQELQKVENWTQYTFHWVVSVPCFWLLVLAWGVASDMQKGRLFIEKNTLRVKQATVILLVDILLFLAGNIVFAVLGWNKLFILQLFAATIGLIVAILLFVLSQYLMKAANLQEECDLTV